MKLYKLAVGATLAAAAIITGAGGAHAQALFEAARDADARAASLRPAYVTPVAVRRHSVLVSPATLTAHLVPNDVDGQSAGERVRRAEALSGRVDMTLLPGFTASFTRDTVEAPDEGGWVWHGKGTTGAADNATLVVRGQRISGVVQVGNRHFRITPRGGRLHEVTEEAVDRLPKDFHPHTPAVRGAGQPNPHADARADLDGPQAVVRIDVLVVYTRKASLASADIRDEIRLAIAMANTAHKNSGSNIRLRLVGTRALPNSYNEDARSYSQNLTDMTSGTALSSVRQWRNQFGADLVAMIRQGGSYCGIAWAPTPPTAGHHIYGYSVTSRGGCITGNTFAHELGHNKGLLHDRFVQSPAGNDVYHFGHVDTVGRFRTIMSYSNKCTAAGVTCTRIPNFSSPARKHGGRPTGIAKGKAGAADAARRLRENAKIVAAWRGTASASARLDTTADPDRTTTKVGHSTR